ncbi:MAG: NUDIX hydrolase [Gammaproteobacteria bacterium]|nr:NUDIX hydrolase [Gammaproteobacteria bacterium]
MIWKPHVTVAAVVEREGRFLIVEEEADGRVVYNQPAGHLDEGESLAHAVVREALEETAWHFKPDGVLGIYRWTNPDSKITYLRVCFRGTCDVHEPHRALDNGILRVCWMTRAEIENLKTQLRSPLVLRCVDDYLAGKSYPLALLTDVA